ncbi:MAG: trimethylamine methyltransferase family protein [Rhodospirillales bacterium]|nr:trimethylamine methyltransferase family protein [Rhodospirillales bacterium]
MSEIAQQRKSRRSGGRQAKLATRAAPLDESIRPIRGGMDGGTYRPLSDNDISLIHDAALRMLEEIGLSEAPPSGIAAMAAAGAILGDDGRLRFPRALVLDMLSKAARNITLFGQHPRHDLQPGGKRVYYGTGGAAVHIVDVKNRDYRESQLQDLYDAARIVDQLDNIHYFQRPVVARDMEDGRDLDINTVYACVSGTTKHIGTSFINPNNVADALKLLHAISGGEEKWRTRPFVSNSVCFVVPPFKFATEACEVMEACIHGGLPILLLSAGQAGATAPPALAGAVTQATAECLAGIVYVNSIKSGHPAIFGTWPFVSDLRTGSMSGGSGEQALLSAACAQMAHYYDLPGASAAGMADSKLPDIQSGYEKGISTVMAGLAGLNLIYECAGMHASLLGFCLESLIIDNDMLGQSLRCVRGIEVNETTLSVEAVRQVCLEGPGHYLGHEQTLNLMQTEYAYPAFADRSSPKQWDEWGKPDLVENATVEKMRILNTVFPDHIDRSTDDVIRSMLNIKLPQEAMSRS